MTASSAAAAAGPTHRRSASGDECGAAALWCADLLVIVDDLDDLEEVAQPRRWHAHSSPGCRTAMGRPGCRRLHCWRSSPTASSPRRSPNRTASTQHAWTTVPRTNASIETGSSTPTVKLIGPQFYVADQPPAAFRMHSPRLRAWAGTLPTSPTARRLSCGHRDPPSGGSWFVVSHRHTSRHRAQRVSHGRRLHQRRRRARPGVWPIAAVVPARTATAWRSQRSTGPIDSCSASSIRCSWTTR